MNIFSNDDFSFFHHCEKYGCEWKVIKETTLFKKKDTKSAIVGSVSIGDNVAALTGDVHVEPLKLIVEEDYGTHKKGETIWLLNYLGEGFYRAWKKDELIRIDLPFSPYQEMSCRLDDRCWALIEGDYKMNWWVKFRTGNGLVGWSDQAGHFSDKDSCS